MVLGGEEGLSDLPAWHFWVSLPLAYPGAGASGCLSQQGQPWESPRTMAKLQVWAGGTKVGSQELETPCVQITPHPAIKNRHASFRQLCHALPESQACLSPAWADSSGPAATGDTPSHQWKTPKNDEDQRGSHRGVSGVAPARIPRQGKPRPGRLFPSGDMDSARLGAPEVTRHSRGGRAGTDWLSVWVRSKSTGSAPHPLEGAATRSSSD